MHATPPARSDKEMLQHINEDEISTAHGLFNTLDTNADHSISLQELTAGNLAGEFALAQSEQMLKLHDANANGELHFPEFAAMMYPRAIGHPEP